MDLGPQGQGMEELKDAIDSVLDGFGSYPSVEVDVFGNCLTGYVKARVHFAERTCVDRTNDIVS
jgi:hypothetical protein